MDCIVNKTAISSWTNKIIGPRMSSKYLLALKSEDRSAFR